MLGQARWLILLVISFLFFKRHRTIFSNPRGLWNKPSAAFMSISTWGTLSQWKMSWYNLDLAASRNTRASWLPWRPGQIYSMQAGTIFSYTPFQQMLHYCIIERTQSTNQPTNQKTQERDNFQTFEWKAGDVCRLVM